MTSIMWFDEYDPALRLYLGGKCASLGEMTQAGMPVPPGFAVTTEAFQAAVRPSGLHDEIDALLAGLDHSDTDALTSTAHKARTMIRDAELPASIEDEIRAACARIDEVCQATDMPLAVRSSATCEDSPDASFAGEHDTYLWIRGADAVLDRIRSCWASLYTDRAVAYRAKMGYSHETVDMCVGVQKMVRPVAAGVAFTLNPRDGDRSQIAIDAAWGFGEAVVSGEVTPDNFLVDKVLFEIVRRQTSTKECEYALGADDRVRRVELDPQRASAPSLTDDQIKAVAKLARRAEKHYGRPQDIEWAVDTDLPEGQNVVLLQSRPETVWSRKPRERLTTGGGDYLSSIVSTLTAPLHTHTDS
ncbi:MAG: hypothetical protein M3400_11575 [Actinomycetota bacterium]|nr:hypothetical protein [Actinomycetota bacterium]